VPPLEQIFPKRNQPGKFVGGVSVFFDDVKRAIIASAKAPDAQRQQKDGLPTRIIQVEQNSSDDADKQKQQTFDFYPVWIGEVSHN
jgi:hypothetical protein